MTQAVNKAIELLDNYCIERPEQLNLEEIANAEYLIIECAPLKNELGRIVYHEDFGLIKINSSIKETGIKNFTIAHEIGHFWISRDRKIRKHGCTTDNISSFKTSNKAEQEANEFAAELLMHKPWFSDFVRHREINMDLIKELANYFNVSLTAAAIRYAEIGKYPVAVIMSKDDKVAWSYINEYFPLKFIPRGYHLRKHSIAYDYFNGGELQDKSDLVPAGCWFSEDFNYKEDIYLWEHSLAMPGYNSVLTLLWQYEY
jgi:Zn-dependent peptidase ImmA (M78 family)